MLVKFVFLAFKVLNKLNNSFIVSISYAPILFICHKI